MYEGDRVRDEAVVSSDLRIEGFLGGQLAVREVVRMVARDAD